MIAKLERRLGKRRVLLTTRDGAIRQEVNVARPSRKRLFPPGVMKIYAEVDLDADGTLWIWEILGEENF